MELVIADDSRRNSVQRDGMGPLVGIGGVLVPGTNAGRLERTLESFATYNRCPPGEEFKWTPPESHWMRDLTAEERQRFYRGVLGIAWAYDVRVFVVVSDTRALFATDGATSHEIDVTTMFMERVDAVLAGLDEEGILIIDEPSGGPKDQERFLADCIRVLNGGTNYRDFQTLPLAPLKSRSHHMRILQLADVVTGVTTAMVAGQETYATQPFEIIKEMMHGDPGRKGGYGLKLHPDFTYSNLYHWLLGDTHAWRDGGPVELPSPKWPYATSAYRRSNNPVESRA